MTNLRTLAILLFAFAAASALQAKEGGCDAYALDVSRELDLMQAPATSMGANWNIKQAAMPLEVDEHYLIALHPQGSIGFVVPTGNEPREASSHGGIAYFHVEDAGRYRIALDTAHWIDVVEAGANVLDPAQACVLPSVAHEGRHGCEALRKIVAFDLQGGRTYRLHFSGRSADRVNVAITRERAH